MRNYLVSLSAARSISWSVDVCKSPGKSTLLISSFLTYFQIFVGNTVSAKRMMHDDSGTERNTINL